MTKIELSSDEWREKLSKDQYNILRLAGTEKPFTGELLDNVEKGLYKCAGCDTVLFESETKYDSSCGWPSFYQAYASGNVTEREDTSRGRIRTEILCSKCDGHLGHVFEDGPRDKTGLRYCINSLSLVFEKL